MSLFDIQLNYLNDFGTERFKQLVSLYYKIKRNKYDKRRKSTFT